ncbi:probable WRKY transcription factor 35 [Zingiber officinale]|uniref:probable WRKY transcription factor 35 n=1 Tax=Zingiber officinale TaxID=94328 RepID=UPI001C4B176C|nr:probable WRKY transcription factor 35 [Zingiber officinale]
MCDYFLQRMDDDHGGYLADIVHTGGHFSCDGDLDPLLDDSSWQLDDHLLSVSANGDCGDPFAVPLVNPFSHFGGADHDGEDGTSQLPPPPPPRKAAEQDFVKASTAAASCSILPKVHQISPLLTSPAPAEAEEMMMMKAISAGCPMAGGAGDHYGGVQIPPHMATPGIKRRKSQARKVVYIPAPAAASNRPSGEVVPSDRWAWRKYGQKPIKGSPYPRGYYRCSSSKGCSARKQVERSRTDPNMLVITYTSEHNHPWPTQRNALAGSVRSHSSKSTTNSTKSPTSAASANDSINPDGEPLPNSTTSPPVNEPGGAHYKPMIPGSDGQAEDFFSDLAELESDPMSLIFSKGFADGKLADEAAVDPLLSMFDWAESSS